MPSAPVHRRPASRWLAVLALSAGIAGAETFVWVDEDGVTHLTDDASALAASAAGPEAELRGLWETVVPPEATGGAAPVGRSAGAAPLPVIGGDRTARLLRGAADDIRRGETARASAALEAILREEPGRPEAHWYLADIDRRRSRFDSAEAHLRAFLSAAGEPLDPWRAEANRRLAALSDERRLADESRLSGPGEFRRYASEHFRVDYDRDLGEASPGYAGTVLGMLEEARVEVGNRLGAVPEEPMGVVFYGKAAYLRAHAHRFSFQTVGFFDGRIHVVSAAHPDRQLRDLLFHEYTHALFREHTGGDRPFWLNEGLAELSERSELGDDGLTRSERVSIRIRIDHDEWLPLRRLAPSFGGLSDDDARAAYLEATAAAAWIEGRTSREQRARLLERLGAGASDDEALLAVLGLDTDGVDAAVQAAILAEFPELPRLRGDPSAATTDR